jgi:tetratricopeptide (TPR) repeat protein
MTPSLLVSLLLAATNAGPRQAELLAADAVQLSPRQPEAALTQALRALALTAEFDPTMFVAAGRKGEVVEDEFLQARNEYRRHRAGLYDAVGQCLARLGRHVEARRYLARAVLLESTSGHVTHLARELIAEGRPRAALDRLAAQSVMGGLSPDAVALIEEAADTVGAPSAQAEIDRARLGAMKGVEVRDGPLRLPPEVRLSSGGVLRFEDGLTVMYVTDTSCRTCSGDLESLKRALPPDARVVMVPPAPDQDIALRQVLTLYRYPWPVLVGKGAAQSLAVKPVAALLVARSGWIGAVVRPPFWESFTIAIKLLSRVDVTESVPRAKWNNRPVDRRPDPPPPALTPEGLAPGEDLPLPGPFIAAADAYKAGRGVAALRFLEALENKGDGWLLPPEARFDRALCLAAAGQREAARKLLLRIGDSRFQDAVDRALERVGSHNR